MNYLIRVKASNELYSYQDTTILRIHLSEFGSDGVEIYKRAPVVGKDKWVLISKEELQQAEQ